MTYAVIETRSSICSGSSCPDTSTLAHQRVRKRTPQSFAQWLLQFSHFHLAGHVADKLKVRCQEQAEKQYNAQAEYQSRDYAYPLSQWSESEGRNRLLNGFYLSPLMPSLAAMHRHNESGGSRMILKVN
jgi:hypothetical protein